MKSLILAILAFCVAINTYASTYGAKILKDNVKVKCYSDGRKEWIEEKEIKILSREGVKEFGEIVIPFSHEHQKVEILYAYTVLPDGRTVKPQKNAFNIVYPPFQAMAPIYSDLRYQTISMPAVKPGVILKYAFKVETVKPYMKNQFWTTNFFQSVYPVEHATFKLSVPADKKIKIKEYNFYKKPVIKRKAGRIEYFYELHNIPPIKEEPSMPPVGELAKKIAVTSLSSWNQVARWYSELAREAVEPDNYVKETTLKVIKGKKGKLEQIKAIYNFVAQNIRYVGLEFGINGYKPHTASSVLKNRYGDCKDHATLLIAMLKVIGIKGYPVLIPTQGVPDMDVDMPTPTAFNHEIAAIKLNGKWLYLDTTSDTVPFGELPASDQGRHVLIVDVENQKGFIEETPIYPAESNREEFIGNFTVDNSGNLKGNLLFNYTGVYAHRERAILSSFTTPYDEKQFIERTVSSVIPGFEVEKFKISNYKNLNKKMFTFLPTEAAHYLRQEQNILCYSTLLHQHTQD
ncbi:DUF3857 domain-containing transglutaminase family protein [Desulfurobacterium atlanticum]|uniref:Transglutaminase-like superfamily protein n=1 Tax=Desulfurobacterium atlanticum TaxID=240169 RepID=A0A238XXN1_9BACT|nr:DUF3857 domain-containing protein [Desulfurobacterium atlanticum]SNR63183.1 Transglutaminase-like superfamily protein [Desulfurobacterium atlanticum]